MKAAKRARTTEQLLTNFVASLLVWARIPVISTIIDTVNGMVVWYFDMERKMMALRMHLSWKAREQRGQKQTIMAE